MSLSPDSVMAPGASAARDRPDLPDGRSLASSFSCQTCQEPNAAQRKYCSKCGGRLWDPCLQCGAANQCDERFCGGCGADLAATLQEQRRQIEQTLAAAEQLAQDGRCLDAVEHLKTIGRSDHSQLSRLLAEAAQRTLRYPHMHQEAIADAEVAATEAQSLLADGRVDEAHARLSRVPPALQSGEIKKLAHQIGALHAESARLRAFITAALREKKYSGLLPLVERLAELNSDDAKIAALLGQLRTLQAKNDRRTTAELISLAKAALAEYDYHKALSAVRRIPGKEQVGDVLTFAQQVRERAWLFDRLHTEPHASPTLLKVAERLAKLQPTDTRVAKLAHDLQRRCDQYRQQPRNGKLAWARPPETTALGIAVDLAPVPEELIASQPQHPERAASLLTAYGLALQAAGQAAHALNLDPEQKSESWLGRVGSLRARKAPVCWGIDVGSSALKAVKLSTGGERPVIEQSLVVPYATKKSAGADVEVLRSNVIAAFLKRYDLSGGAIALNLPGTHTLGRFFQMPVPRKGKFEDALKFELRARLPLSEEQCVYDAEATDLDAPVAASTTPMRRVMLIAGSREHLHRVLAPWQDAGAAQIIIQSECLALANALQASGQPLLHDAAYLELGAQGANLVACTPAGLWFRGLYAGASAFDRAIAKRLNITSAEAESLRRQPDQAAFMHQLDDFLQEDFAAVADAIRRGLEQLRHDGGASPSRLLLCGGGACQFGLLRYLRLGK